MSNLNNSKFKINFSEEIKDLKSNKELKNLREMNTSVNINNNFENNDLKASFLQEPTVNNDKDEFGNLKLVTMFVSLGLAFLIQIKMKTNEGDKFFSYILILKGLILFIFLSIKTAIIDYHFNVDIKRQHKLIKEEENPTEKLPNREFSFFEYKTSESFRGLSDKMKNSINMSMNQFNNQNTLTSMRITKGEKTLADASKIDLEDFICEKYDKMNLTRVGFTTLIILLINFITYTCTLNLVPIIFVNSYYLHILIYQDFGTKKIIQIIVSFAITTFIIFINKVTIIEQVICLVMAFMLSGIMAARYQYYINNCSKNDSYMLHPIMELKYSSNILMVLGFCLLIYTEKQNGEYYFLSFIETFICASLFTIGLYLFYSYFQDVLNILIYWIYIFIPVCLFLSLLVSFNLIEAILIVCYLVFNTVVNQ